VRLLLGTVVLAGSAAAVAPASLVAAKPPPVIAVNCTVAAATVFVEPAGKLQVVEYRYDLANHIAPTSTGRLLVAVDATTRTVNSAAPCHRIAAVKKREPGFAGPWPRTVESRITCVAPTKGYGLDFQLRPVLNKARQVIGNRIVVVRKNVVGSGKNIRLVKFAAADAWVTRTGGGVKFEPGLCDRNLYP